ncbi:MAG TPA: protein-export chaperone SecB [Candidatus Sulfotelmatobacter sp.]|jgi:preprotein translocase subunit SecB|nr:protein-export chaperone SecB [Candidatus Sulfotelmatobacter sp.]
MSDQEAQQAQPPLLVNLQYVKDLSFEVPGAPGIFVDMQTVQPEIGVKVNINANPIQGNAFEVALHLNIDAKLGEKTAFILELVYAGVFTLNVPPEHVQPMLLIECPRLLFPFARNIVSDTTRDGGFPPMLLQPIDFVALFRQRLEQAEAEGHA